MENPTNLKPLEPLGIDAKEDHKNIHKGLSEVKLITILTGVLLAAFVIGIVIYSQSAQRYKGDLVLTHMVAPETDQESAVSAPAIIETSVDGKILQEAVTSDSVIPGITIPETSIPSEIIEEAVQPQPDAGTDGISAAPGVSVEEVLETTVSPEVAAPESSVADSDILDLQKEMLDAIGDTCDQYKAELDYAYYHDEWIGSEKSYASSLTGLKNNNCLSECDFAFYDGLLQLHYENYGLDSGIVPLDSPIGAKASVLNLLSECDDKCEKIFDMYAFFVEYAKSQEVYSANDKNMMHYLMDSNIETCGQCMELSNPVFDESKYFTKEFEFFLDDIRTRYDETYLNLPLDVPQEIPDFYAPQTFVPVAYAASEDQVLSPAELLSSGDLILVTAENAVENDISNYLQNKCPVSAECTEVHFVDPLNPSIQINSFDAVYNEKINNEALLVQADGISADARFEFSTDTPIDPLLKFTDGISTGNPLVTDSPNVNIFTDEIVTAFDIINVRVIDGNNNIIGTCSSSIPLRLADAVEFEGSSVQQAPVEEESTTFSETTTEEEATPSSETTSGSSSTTTTTTTSSSTTSGGGTTTGESTSTTTTTTSGGVAGGTLPRCTSLEIIRPLQAKADGVPVINISENGYINENLTIRVVADSGVVGQYRFKSLNNTISFNNQGPLLDVPSTVKTVTMSGGPGAGEEDTVTVWALDNMNGGIQSCHDAFVVTVPAAIVAGVPGETEEPAEDTLVIPAVHPAQETPEDTQEPAPIPAVHEGAETEGAETEGAETPAETAAELDETLPPMTPDDGPGVLVYFLGAGLGGLIFTRKKKNK